MSARAERSHGGEERAFAEENGASGAEAENAETLGEAMGAPLRQRLAWPVRIAVAVGLLICVLAVLRGKLGRDDAALQQRPAPALARAPSSATPAVPAVPQPVQADTSEQAPAGDREAARLARRESQQALERHDLPHALEAAERAVLFDPEDAEGWLLLGAAHIDRGNNLAAQRAFKQCVGKAKLGDRQECLALIR
jgi:cytochrome c-type biogenesis protein CcmH/NrfG